MSHGKRLRDLAVETLVAIVLVTAFVVYLFERPPNAPPIDSRLVFKVVNTAIVFGYLLSWFRSSWRKRPFRTVMALMLAGHLALYEFAISQLERIPMIWYGVLDGIECGVFSGILVRLPWNRSGRQDARQELPRVK